MKYVHIQKKLQNGMILGCMIPEEDILDEIKENKVNIK